jgi:hypothetical protein
MEKLRDSDNSVSRLLSGGMPANLAKAALHKLPQDKRSVSRRSSSTGTAQS